MIDAHCHLNFHKFEQDLPEVISRAEQAGVKYIVNVGTSLESSREAMEIADIYESCFAVVGIHPHHADKVGGQWIDTLEELLSHKKVIGVGEIGLDFFSYKSNGVVDPSIQENIFTNQLELAIKHSLPIQIHNRHAGKEILEILERYHARLQSPPGMFHCFAGDTEILEKALALGFYIGFDGNSTYDGLAPGESTELKTLIAHTPLDRIIIETDSPYLTPIPLRGTRNEPKNAIIVNEFVAHIKGVSPKELESVVDQNFSNIFGKLV